MHMCMIDILLFVFSFLSFKLQNGIHLDAFNTCERKTLLALISHNTKLLRVWHIPFPLKRSIISLSHSLPPPPPPPSPPFLSVCGGTYTYTYLYAYMCILNTCIHVHMFTYKHGCMYVYVCVLHACGSTRFRARHSYMVMPWCQNVLFCHPNW